MLISENQVKHKKFPRRCGQDKAQSVAELRRKSSSRLEAGIRGALIPMRCSRETRLLALS